MRNSSTARKRDDKRGVIQICTVLGGTWGYGGMITHHLFQYRSTSSERNYLEGSLKQGKGSGSQCNI